MESATFQKWPAEQGYRFDTDPEKRGAGHANVTVHRVGRKAEVPLGGPHQIPNARIVRRAREELGLDWSELTGHAHVRAPHGADTRLRPGDVVRINLRRSSMSAMATAFRKCGNRGPFRKMAQM
jgi:hypothetical protein